MHGGNDKVKPAKRKQTTLKTRKSLGEPRHDSEDDFKPTKAKAKKAPAASTLKEKPVATTSKEKLPAVKPKYEESDEEAEIILAPKSKPARVDPPHITEIESEEDKPKVKAAPKRKRYVLVIVHCHDLPSIPVAIASS